MQGSEIRKLVRERFPEAVISEHDFRGDDTLVMQRAVIHDVLRFLKDEPSLRINQLLDICGVDYLGKEPRFELVYHLLSLGHNHRIRLRFPIEEENMVVPTVTDLWPAADWFEREAFDMYGFRFLNHPNLRRILTHEEFEGYPLRKDYPVNRRTQIRPPVEDLLTHKPYRG